MPASQSNDVADGASSSGSSTADRIRALIAKDFRIEPDRLTPDARLDELGVDSIGMAEVIFNVEDEFGLKLPDTAVQLATFGDVVRYIDDALAAQHGPAAAGAGSAAASGNAGDPPSA